MTSPIKLRFTADPCNGWLHVKRDIARMIMGPSFGLISRFSYQRGATIYLEEGCDADRFLQAASKAGLEVDIRVTHYNKPAPIRGYRPFWP